MPERSGRGAKAAAFTAAVAVFFSGAFALQSYFEARRYMQAARLYAVSDALAKAAFAAEKERAVTRAALADGKPASARVIRDITDIRLDADIFFNGALEATENGAVQLPAAKTEEARKIYKELRKLRRRADKDIDRLQRNRSRNTGREWPHGVSDFIETADNMRYAVSYAAESYVPADVARAARNAHIARSVYARAEKEAEALHARIAGGVKAPMSQLLRLAGEYGQAQALHAQTEPEYDDAARRVTQSFFGRFQTVREEVYAAASQDKAYPVTAEEWRAFAAPALDALQLYYDTETGTRAALLRQHHRAAIVTVWAALLFCALSLAAGLKLRAGITRREQQVVSPPSSREEAAYTVSRGVSAEELERTADRLYEMVSFALKQASAAQEPEKHGESAKKEVTYNAGAG